MIPRRIFPAIPLLFLLSIPAPAQEPAPAPPPPAWQVRLEKANASPDAWRARRAEIRQRILVAAGLWPEFERAPLKPVVFGKIERDGYSVEKVHFETWPGFHLTGNLYRPLGKTGLFPAVLCPHGHWKNGRFEDTADASVPGRSLTLARLGFVVFTYDMVGYGDNKPLAHEFCDPAWGISLCGLQLWNGIRAADFVASLPDVDAKRISCTGASGGGTQTFLLTAVDDRIQCAAPVNMVAAEFQGGCPCENAPLLRIDLNNVEIAAATAPRALLLISATGDWTKTNPKDVDPEVGKAYTRLGVPERFRGVQLNYGHNYNKDSREAMYAWFTYWLKPPGWEQAVASEGRGATPARTDAGDPGGHGRPPLRIPEPAFTVEKREDLAVWGPDHPLPEGAADRAKLEETMRGAIRAQLEALRPRDAAGLAKFREVMERSLESVLTVHWHEIDDKGMIQLGPDGTAHEIKIEFVGKRPEIPSAPYPIVILPDDPASTGSVNPAIVDALSRKWGEVVRWGSFKRPEPASNAAHGNTEKFATTYYRTELAWRTSDVMSPLEIHSVLNEGPVHLAGVGRAGIPVLLAAALAPPGKANVVIVDWQGLDLGDASAWPDGYKHPGLQRVGGLRTAGCLIAAKGGKLVIHNTQGKFDATWIRDAFKAAGREGDLIVDEKAWGAERIVEELARLK